MRPLRAVSVLTILLIALPAWAGCLGDSEAPPDPPGTGRAVLDRPSGPRDTLVAENETIDLAPWSQDLGPVREEPNLRRLGQADWAKTGFGALRLLSDGQAFVLVVDAREMALPEGALVLARVHEAESGYTLARGIVPLEATGQTVLPLPSHDAVRVGNTYAFEAYLVRPDASEDLAALTSSEPNPGLGARNVTLLHTWSDTLRLHPTWDLAFDGPAEGTDKPDAVERFVDGGPETGLYTFTFSGTRVWLVDVLFDFGRSRVAGTDPHMSGNGTSSLRVQLDGWKPLETYLEMTPAKGLEEAFAMKVHVDHETRDDMPGEEEQFFFVTAAIGYRLGGSTYVADTAGRDLVVQVRGTI